MTRGERLNLTDDQWLALMKLTPDTRPVRIAFPRAPGTIALHEDSEGRRRVIHPDGRIEDAEAGAERS